MSTADTMKTRATPDKRNYLSKYHVDEFKRSPEKDIDLDYDGDSDMDHRVKMRRKLKKERKDAIMSGTHKDKHEE